MECMLEYREETGWVDAECEFCGESVQKTRWEYESAERAFCDRECHNDWLASWDNPEYQGGLGDPYGPGWSKARRKTLERDGYACQICGDSIDELGREPDVHHIIPANDFPTKPESHYLTNLVCLCRSHHMSVERGSIDLETELPADLVTELEIPTNADERQAFIARHADTDVVSADD